MWSRMRMRTTVLLATAALLCSAPAAARTKPSTVRVKTRTSETASRTRASSRKSARPAARIQAAGTRRGNRGRRQPFVKVVKTKFRGQQSIDQARTMEIQQALSREHYFDGEATGEWNQATRDALIRFQDDNHWQTRSFPMPVPSSSWVLAPASRTCSTRKAPPSPTRISPVLKNLLPADRTSNRWNEPSFF